MIGTPYDIGFLGSAPLDAATTTISLTTTAAVAGGDRIIVSVGLNYVVTSTADLPIVCSDTDGNIYSLDVAVLTGNYMAGICSTYTETGLASGSTITATFDSSVTEPRIAGAGCSGLAVENAVDITTCGNNVPSASWSTLPVTTFHPNVLIWVADAPAEVGFSSQSSTITVPSVEMHDFFVFDGSGTSNFMSTAYRIESTADTYTVAGTHLHSATITVLALAVYKDTAPDDPNPDAILQRP